MTLDKVGLDKMKSAVLTIEVTEAMVTVVESVEKMMKNSGAPIGWCGSCRRKKRVVVRGDRREVRMRG